MVFKWIFCRRITLRRVTKKSASSCILFERKFLFGKRALMWLLVTLFVDEAKIGKLIGALLMIWNWKNKFFNYIGKISSLNNFWTDWSRLVKNESTSEWCSKTQEDFEEVNLSMIVLDVDGMLISTGADSWHRHCSEKI